LFALEQLKATGIHELLERAAADRDRDVAGAAVVLLHRLGDRRAAEILVQALRAQSYPPSRIATQLDQFPIAIEDVLRPLLGDAEPHARYWGASLLRRYAGARDLAPAVAVLTNDPSGPVRKVALDTLAELDREAAHVAASQRLGDPVDFVRSTAVRVLARLGAADPVPEARRVCARMIAPLLADTSWDVRLATKESLVSLGLTVWSEVAAGLESPDRFARNTSAEILQNLGLIDSVIEELSRDVTPSPEVVHVLERVFKEGGPAMVDAAVARSGPQRIPSAGALLARLGIAA
jgi:HEAT repeat protein